MADINIQELGKILADYENRIESLEKIVAHLTDANKSFIKLFETQQELIESVEKRGVNTLKILAGRGA